MQDATTDMREGDRAAWEAMLDGWRRELARVGEDWGAMPAASAMLFVALKGLQGTVGDAPLAAMLEGVAGKVRAGEPITMRAAL